MLNFSRTKIICFITVLFAAALFIIVLSRQTFTTTDENPYSGKIPTRKVVTTNGVRYIVPTEEIIGGGPEKDEIPSIDKPEFVTTEQAREYLTDEEYGIGFIANNTAYFYPFNILSWHEVINNTHSDSRMVLSYSPLCRSAVAFDPTVNNEPVEFGTSGKLWNSGSILYDRRTGSLWSHILRQSIQGDAAGSMLNLLPTSLTTFGAWRELYSDTNVLSRNTRYTFSYDKDPYETYYASEETYFPNPEDNRLAKKTQIIGLIVNKYAKAYERGKIYRAGEIRDEIGGTPIVLRYNATLDIVESFSTDNTGKENRLVPYEGYWFCWSASYPNTQLF